MFMLLRRHCEASRTGRGPVARLAGATPGLALAVMWVATSSGLGGEAGPTVATRYYSTAASPPDYTGPRPTLLAFNDRKSDDGGSAARGAAGPAPVPTRVASTASHISGVAPKVPATPKEPASAADAPKIDPIALAKQAVTDCQARYAQIRDYTCTFLKRERINGRLTSQHVMNMKARTSPSSVYFHFQQPNKGREAIYVHGRNGGNVVAHDVGLGRLVAGTLHLDPRGSRAMEDCRHPITEAGIGPLIETVAHHWSRELTPEDSEINFHPNLLVGKQPCLMVESIHPRRKPDFMFHKVKLYIDREHGVPIRFEAYDWPKHPGAAPELVEEYTYLNLRVNVGLRDHDFDPRNAQYSFGRF